MADEVHVHNDPPRRGSSAAIVWALVVLVLVAIIAWFVLRQDSGSGVPEQIDVDIEAPAAPSPQ